MSTDFTDTMLPGHRHFSEQFFFCFVEGCGGGDGGCCGGFGWRCMVVTAAVIVERVGGGGGGDDTTRAATYVRSILASRE